jgi:very-short-patch-repair endonuclease
VKHFAGVAQSFAANFDHPARSPWSQIAFTDVPPYSAPRFLKALLALRGPALALQEAITRYGGLGISHADDFTELADLDSTLGDVPELAALSDIAGLDLGDLDQALGLRSELLKLERELGAMPDLRCADIEHLSMAAELMRSRLAGALSEQVPAVAYKLSDGEAIVLEDLLDAVEAVLPALEVLGLDSKILASHLRAVAFAVHILSGASQRYLRWFVELQHAPKASVVEAIGRWRSLVDAEGSWAAKLQGYHLAARPKPSDLEVAAAILRKGRIGKAVAALNGSLRAARELCQRIRIDTTPDELDALAAHVRAILNFEANQELGVLFRSAWRGLETPMDEVHEGIKVRELLKDTVLPLPGGEHVIERVSALTVDRMASLSPIGSACKGLLSLPSETMERLKDTPLDRFVSDARKRIATLREFLSVDPHRLLAGFDAPICRIAHAGTLLKRVVTISKALADHTTAAQARTLGSSDDRIAVVSRAIAWAKSIRATCLNEGTKSLLLSHRAGEVREAMRQAARELSAIIEDRTAAVTGLAEFGVESIAAMPSFELVQLIDNLLEHGQELSDYLALRHRRLRLDAAGLGEFLSTCDHHAVEPERMTDLFSTVVAERRAGMARRVVELASNNGASLEVRRRDFAERDLAKIKADRATIRARLLQATPPVGSNYGPRKTWTEMKLLANEFPKMKRLTPVRQLLTRAGSAVQALKPCFMMSPLSLAKFIASGSVEFDLLVIDEASQMRPEDAIGGMLRAKQIVVVGDAKQLPPTDFFARVDSQVTDDATSDVEDDDIDAESILEACESTFGERRRLKWHYRSRCESLIAFSNRSFYDDKLITFPTAKPGSFSIELVRVDGTYRARRNPGEAAEVADKAVAFMRYFAHEPEDRLPTIGIVALNVEQREFIEEELRRLWTDDDLVELYLEKVRTKGEPFFVKNLENVQGDERDHIFISMTYGRKHGEPAVSQNFGPINRKQGHRRLNVLFTRARVRIGLFTSFGSADVRLTESSSEGVRALKSYLEYAETRGMAIVKGIGDEPDSDFESEVATRLRMRGYLVDLQVGVSGFRIDLGVRHPDQPEHFLAGVECDGATYHSSKSARDRDRLREEVLSNLGWNLVRVWSTDWFDNPQVETEKLVRKLEELRRRPTLRSGSYPPLCDGEAGAPIDGLPEKEARQDSAHTGQQAEVSEVDGPEAASPIAGQDTNVIAELRELPGPRTGPGPLTDDGPLTPQEAAAALELFREEVIRPSIPEWEVQRSILRPAMIETFIRQRIVDPAEWYTRIPQYLRIGTNPAEKTQFLERICEIVERIGVPGRSGPMGNSRIGNGDATSFGTCAYEFADLAAVRGPDRGRFFDATHTTMLKAMITRVIEVEGPIFEDVLVDRISRAYGLRRSGSQIRRRVVGLLPSSVSRVKEGERVVVWPFGKEPGITHAYRKDQTGRRGHEDVPVEELAAIAAPFVRLRMDDEAVLRKMAEEFQLGRLREATRSRFEVALQIARLTLI